MAQNVLNKHTVTHCTPRPDAPERFGPGCAQNDEVIYGEN